MANELKGEASFESDGKQYTVRIDIESIMEIESKLDMPFYEFIEQLEDGTYKLTYLLKMLQCVLKRHHGELPLNDVGSVILGQDGGKAVHAIHQATINAFPRAEKNGNAGTATEGVETKKKDGTGDQSSEIA